MSKPPSAICVYYEFGDETGRKVMLVHGDATSAPLWRQVAEGLVEMGCRVIVLDLWGRGYSSSPNAIHDARLFGLQLLFAASSSPLPWCSEGFSILGFSLGGGIAMDFVASFPHLVQSVALLAPVGLLRDLPASYQRLQQAARERHDEAELKEMLASILGVEQSHNPAAEEPQSDHPEKSAAVDSDAIQRWQFLHHEGHAASFISSLLHGPIQHQHEMWREASRVLREKRRSQEGKDMLVVICGSEDGVVSSAHLQEDLDAIVGRGEYVFEEVPGGHGFLLDKAASEEVVGILRREWNL
ncbi:hypothetical protein LTR12_013583 [Friedmanniomyces endolithicus]|nr:hypothetical protein LTR12_013583 [Friedmanniomyces endolithicus]